MDIQIDVGLETEFTIYYKRSVYDRHGWSHDEYSVGGQGSDLLRGLPDLIKAAKLVVNDPNEENVVKLNKALETCFLS